MTTALDNFRAAEVHHIEIDGVRVAYRVFGAGPALLFVHGWPMSGVTYRGLIEELQGEFTCYVPDLPGAGDSPWAPRFKDSFEDFGKLLSGFTQALNLDNLGVIGFDSGGAVARVFAANSPDRVRALALTNTEVPNHPLPLVRAFQIAAAVPGAGWAFRRLLGSRAYLRSKYGFAGTFANLELLDGEFHETSIAPLLRDTSGALNVLRNADLGITHRLDELHQRIDTPLLCIWGDRDPFFPVEGARRMVEQWPNQAHLEVLRGQKLFVHEEAHREVADLMRPFLLANLAETKLERVPA